MAGAVKIAPDFIAKRVGPKSFVACLKNENVNRIFPLSVPPGRFSLGRDHFVPFCKKSNYGAKKFYQPRCKIS